MSVYVDKLKSCEPSMAWFWKKQGHLFADTREELLDFASKMSLPETWFQDSFLIPHFNLTEYFQMKALVFGATEIKRPKIAELIMKYNMEGGEPVETRTA